MNGTAERPRVLVYADSKIFSGAESLLCRIVSDVNAAGRFEFSFAAPATNSELVEGLSEATGGGSWIDVPVQAIPLAAFHLYNPRRLGRVRSALRETGADVMLLNLPSAEYGSTPLLAPPVPAIPIVGMMHISGTMGDLGFRVGKVREKLARRAVSKLDQVLLLSERSRRDYAGQWSPRGTDINTIRMPIPVIDPVDPAGAKRKLELPGGKKVIGLAGRLTTKQKGQDTFVEAASIMRGGRTDLAFVLAGEGQDRERIERMIGDRGLTQSFHLLGQVADMSTFLSAIDLIAMPSRFEGLPLIALEALVAGVPGVATSVDGLCDVWPEEWRVEPGRPDLLADALNRLLDAGDAAQQDLVASGRELMKTRTSADASADTAGALERALADV